MTDLFQDKATDWDSRPFPLQISEGVCAAIQAAVPLRATDTVMDFGAGTGLVCGKLAPQVGKVLAVDVSEAMLAKLAEKTELVGKVEPICQDILDTPLGRQVDLVVSAMAMHHVKDTAALCRAMFDHVVPGGQVALADLDQEDGSFHPPGIKGVFHHGFDRTPLGELMKAAGFASVAFQTACEVDKDGHRYPIFLLTATRPK
jgi:2-polyprenyl-3-methyl-5-hydroxy-6-metoxy-1,4-benzoquinol methylase